MKLKLNLIAQIVAGAGQVLVPAAPIPDEWKTFAHALVAFAQITVSAIAHAYTPDGNRL